ncbi:PDZ domain-containing protein [Patescibacteria group bacterium]|nr:MAG: PDZ domain-containing protein [Patescibacteria group bacterium]
MTDTEAKPTKSNPLTPRPFAGRFVLVALICGIIGGSLTTFGLARLVPGLIPVSKQSILLEQSSATIEVAKKVSPSVVSITSESTGFSFFGASQTTQGAGTGVIASSDGLIITNNHVIEGASNLTVFTSEGKEYKDVQVVARDAQNDTAFLRIKASGLKAAELGDSSKIQVGTQVMAIGNALGQFENTVTTGIISGLGRPVAAGDQQGNKVEQLQNLFQTDAAINPGNSGGPLVDLTGKVIGINTAVAGNAQGIGFAIPINQIAAQLETVKTQGKIVKAYIGVRYIPVTKEFAASNDLKVTAGAYLTSSQGQPAIAADSPAAKAGLKEGDIIIKVNNKTIDEDHSLSTLINDYKPGDKVKLTVWRDGQQQTIEVTLGEAPRQ